MFERFSSSARAAVSRARDVAAADGADTVEAEHILLALTQQADEPTARALEALGMTEPAVRKELAEEFTTRCRPSVSPPPCHRDGRRDRAGRRRDGGSPPSWRCTAACRSRSIVATSASTTATSCSPSAVRRPA